MKKCIESSFCGEKGCLNEKINHATLRCEHEYDCWLKQSHGFLAPKEPGYRIFFHESYCKMHSILYQLHLLFPEQSLVDSYYSNQCFNIPWYSNMKHIISILHQNKDNSHCFPQFTNLLHETFLLLSRFYKRYQSKPEHISEFIGKLSLLSNIFKMNTMGYRTRILDSIFRNMLQLDFKTNEQLIYYWETLLALDEKNIKPIMHVICLVTWRESNSLEEIFPELLKIQNSIIRCFLFKYYFIIDHRERSLQYLQSIYTTLTFLDDSNAKQLNRLLNKYEFSQQFFLIFKPISLNISCFCASICLILFKQYPNITTIQLNKIIDWSHNFEEGEFLIRKRNLSRCHFYIRQLPNYQKLNEILMIYLPKMICRMILQYWFVQDLVKLNHILS